MANKIIEQTVPRYKINGISTLTFCSTRAISKPSAVCFGNSSNPPLTSPHFGHTVNPSGTEFRSFDTSSDLLSYNRISC